MRCKQTYRPNRSIFPDCSNTSQTHATCSWVNPKEAIELGDADTAGVVLAEPEVPSSPLAETLAATAAAEAAPYNEADVWWSAKLWYWQTWASDGNDDVNSLAALICEAECISEAAATAAEAATGCEFEVTIEEAATLLTLATEVKSVMTIFFSGNSGSLGWVNFPEFQ